MRRASVVLVAIVALCQSPVRAVDYPCFSDLADLNQIHESRRVIRAA